MKNHLKIKKLLKTYCLDAYIVPKNDEFFSEYVDNYRPFYHSIFNNL